MHAEAVRERRGLVQALSFTLTRPGRRGGRAGAEEEEEEEEEPEEGAPAALGAARAPRRAGEGTGPSRGGRRRATGATARRTRARAARRRRGDEARGAEADDDGHRRREDVRARQRHRRGDGGDVNGMTDPNCLRALFLTRLSFELTSAPPPRAPQNSTWQWRRRGLGRAPRRTTFVSYLALARRARTTFAEAGAPRERTRPRPRARARWRRASRFSARRRGRRARSTWTRADARGRSRARPPRRPLPTPSASRPPPSWPRSFSSRAGLGPSLLEPASVLRPSLARSPPRVLPDDDDRAPASDDRAREREPCSSARCPSARSRSKQFLACARRRAPRGSSKEGSRRALADAWLAKRDEAVRVPLRKIVGMPGNPRAGYVLITLDVGANGGLVDFLIDSGATALVSPKTPRDDRRRVPGGRGDPGPRLHGRDGAARSPSTP